MTPTNPIPEGMKAAREAALRECAEIAQKEADRLRGMLSTAKEMQNSISMEYSTAGRVDTAIDIRRGIEALAASLTPHVGDSAAERAAFEARLRKPYTDKLEATPWHVLARAMHDHTIYADANTRARWADFQAGAAFASHEAAHVGEHLAVAKEGGAWSIAADIARTAGKLQSDAQRVALCDHIATSIEHAGERALAERPALPMPDRGLFQAAANIVYRIEAAGCLSYEADNFERWKADARDLAPRLRLALLSQDRGEGVEGWPVEALGLALGWLIQNEPGDSRAVSDEFVAMAAVHAGIADEATMQIIRHAAAKLERKA